MFKPNFTLFTGFLSLFDLLKTVVFFTTIGSEFYSEFTLISVLSTKLLFTVVDKLFLELDTGREMISSCQSEMLASSKTLT